MNSKNSILQSIREAKPEPTLKPSLDIKYTKYKNRDEKYTELLKSVGGAASWLKNDESIKEFVDKNYDNLGLIATNLNISVEHIKTNDIDDPHALKDIDLAIIKGEFAVAENGAVWVKEDENLNRAIYFIARKLLILVAKGEIVNSMHEAYKRVNFKDGGFGTFISGPSKTADIEQALVIGAHGAMECRVLFI